MKAIEPSSRSSYYERPERPVSVAEYEDIEYIRTHSNEAYTLYQPPQSGPVYDEPETTTKRPLSPRAPLMQQTFPPPADLTSYYEEPSEITFKPLAISATQNKTPLSLSPMHSVMSHTSKSMEKTQENVDSGENCYVDMIKSKSDDDT